jgi:hypothetical protein
VKTREQIQSYIETHPGFNNSRIAHNLKRHGVTSADVAAARGAPRTTVAATEACQPKGRSLKLLIDQFDDVGKVQKAMKALPRDQYLEDDEMRRQLGIALDRWRAVRGHSSLTPYLFRLPNGKFVWMHAAAQQSLTEAINLSQR